MSAKQLREDWALAPTLLKHNISPNNS